MADNRLLKSWLLTKIQKEMFVVAKHKKVPKRDTQVKEAKGQFSNAKKDKQMKFFLHEWQINLWFFFALEQQFCRLNIK